MIDFKTLGSNRLSPSWAALAVVAVISATGLGTNPVLAQVQYPSKDPTKKPSDQEVQAETLSGGPSVKPAPMVVASPNAVPEGDWYDGAPPRGHSSLFVLPNEPDRPRNYWFPPLLSFILPGFDQWAEAQTGPAVVYSSVGLAGYLYGSNAAQDIRIPKDKDDDESVLDNKGNAERKSLIGLQTMQVSGGISAYHSFRTAVRSRPNEFKFLRYEETPKEILLAPFRFDFLARKTTWIPLGLGLAVAGLQISALKADDTDDMKPSKFTGGDALFAGGLSYNAGTHEEAVFRGWVMPMFQEWTDSEWVSATASAAIFAAAHLSTNPRPIPQFMLGYYWGWLSQKNRWTLAEGIFIHAWWDVIFFATSYQFEKISKSDKSSNTNGSKALMPAFMLPPFAMTF